MADGLYKVLHIIAAAGRGLSAIKPCHNGGEVVQCNGWWVVRRGFAHQRELFCPVVQVHGRYRVVFDRLVPNLRPLPMDFCVVTQVERGCAKPPVQCVPWDCNSDVGSQCG